jgi:hypothetical protein
MPHQLPSPCVPFQEQPAARNFLETIEIVLRTTRINIQKFYVVLLLSLCVLYGYQNKQLLLPCTTLTGWFL